MEYHRFTLEPFDSRETGTPQRQQLRRRETATKEERGMRQMYVQTALCALIVALMIVMELFVFREEPETVPASAPKASPAVEASAQASSDAEDGDAEDSLGKLQFVSGRIYSVFSSDTRWALPFSPTETELQEEGKLLRLCADEGTVVRAAAAGQVVSVSQDERYGTTVRIHHGLEKESVYYGLGGVGVEAGQPLLAGDTVGVIGASGELYLAAFENGTAVAVEDLFAAEPLTVT